MTSDAAVHAKAVELVRLVLEMTTAAGSGHPSSAASLAHLVTVLMYGHMRYDPRRPDHPAADRLVLSEGHACPIVYAAAADLGVWLETEAGERRPMTAADAMQLRAADSPIDGHPNPAVGFPFFPAATGSLGQGPSIAAGLALAAELDRSDRRVFCLIGDGESREGQVWEAMDFLVERALLAVLPIFNCNHFGQTGPVSAQQSPSVLAGKLEAYGFDAELIDGHDPAAIRAVLADHERRVRDHAPRPLALVARTVKGWGVPLMQGDGHHGKPVARRQLDEALRQLEATARELGSSAGGELRPRSFTPGSTPRRDEVEVGTPPPATLTGAFAALGRTKDLAGGSLATRDAFGVALRMLGPARPDLVVLDGDVGNSTRTDEFAATPDLAARFVDCRISEQHMVSCAGGLCAGGKTAFVATFGKFLTRAYDQLEMALIGRFPLKLVGSHVGLTPAADGPSQMALADVGFFRALSMVAADGGPPLMHVLTPADPFAAYALTLAMAAHPGACYLRTMRQALPVLYDDDTSFSLGGHRVLASGSDLLIVAWGQALHQAIVARRELEGRGVNATLVDLYSIPFDGGAIAELAAQVGGRVLTVEDNYGGGLGSAVADALAAARANARVDQMFVACLPKSARTPDEALERVGLSARHIVTAAEHLAAK